MKLTADKAHFWRSDKWPGFELMRAHWVRHSFSKHFHDCYTIGINDGGAGNFDCRHKKQDAWPGRLNLIEPGETHTGGASSECGWLYRDFYISVECMHDLARRVNVTQIPEFCSATVHDPELAHEFREVFVAMTTMPATHLEQDYLLVKAIRRLCVRHGCQQPAHVRVSKEREAISRIRDYIHAHFAEEITISRLASLTGWSTFHLIRAFHEATGIPPHAYQNTLRVAQAQEQLRNGESIADAAVSCGFYDQSHMNRLFRRMLGATPGQYRRTAAISSKT